MGTGAQLKKLKEKELDNEKRFWEHPEEYKNPRIINGKKVSVICKKNENESAGLPFYSDTSDIYLLYDKKECKIKQMSIYSSEDHFRAKDFDWSHQHKEHNIVLFEKGELHIHPNVFDNYFNKKGRETRKATEEEIRFLKYILKEFNYDYSKIKFTKEDNT